MKPELEQMNLRVREDVRLGFREFCRSQQMTQSEGLRVLLLQTGSAEGRQMADSFRQELEGKEREIAKLKEENARLRQKSDAAFFRTRRWFSMAKALVACFLVRSAPAAPGLRPPLRARQFKEEGMARLFQRYRYPQSTGMGYLKMEFLIWGKPGRNHYSPLFVLGETPDGEKIKLRYYSKPEYLGIYPLSPQYAFFHSEWLVGYALDESGAADLLAAFPAELLPPQKRSPCADPAQAGGLTLEQKILEANKRRRR